MNEELLYASSTLLLLQDKQANNKLTGSLGSRLHAEYPSASAPKTSCSPPPTPPPSQGGTQAPGAANSSPQMSRDASDGIRRDNGGRTDPHSELDL